MSRRRSTSRGVLRLAAGLSGYATSWCLASPTIWTTSRASPRFAAGLGNVERVDVLPFHQMGQYKWKKLGIPYSLEGIEPPKQELVEAACGVFRRAGLKTH